MFALLMEDVYQFKKLIYLCGNMEKAAKIQKILLSGSPISFSQSYFALDDFFLLLLIFCLSLLNSDLKWKRNGIRCR